MACNFSIFISVSIIIYGIAATNAVAKPLRFPSFQLPLVENVSNSIEFTCRKPIPPLVDMSNVGTFYRPTKTQSSIDPKAMSKYVRRIKPAIRLSRRLQQMVRIQANTRGSSKKVTSCIAEQILTWARAGSLLKNLDQNDPKGQRQAILVAVFRVHLLVKSYRLAQKSEVFSEADHQTIDRWLGQLSDAIMKEFTPQTDRPTQYLWLDRATNHRFWAGAAVGLIAVQLQDPTKFNWAMGIFDQVRSQPQPDGGLPLELRRGERGLHYQSFALKALAILVSLADANIVNITREQERALYNISKFTFYYFNHPQELSAKLGVLQIHNLEMADWMPIIASHFSQNSPLFSARLREKAEELDRNSNELLMYLSQLN